MMTRINRKFKSFSACFLVFCMLIPMSVMQAGAVGSEIHTIEDTKYLASLPGFSSSVDEDALENYLRQELLKSPSQIDISSFGVSQTDASALGHLIYDDLPEMFHVRSLNYGVNQHGIITKLIFSYNYTALQYSEMYADCVESADKILNGIKGNSKLGDVEKALLIHDRLAVLCEYDSENLAMNTVPAESFSMYGALVSKVAVCQGYSEAYEYLLEQVGIESYICESDTLNHAWNIVEINDREYHVDVTWDDPVNDITGRVKHNNFLLSSDGIYNSGHTAYDYDTTPTDTTYDAYFWQNSDTAFQLIDDEIYYFDTANQKIKKYSDKSVVCSVEAIWQADGGAYWTTNFSRLASDGEALLYSKPDAVCKYDLASGTETKIWTPDFSAGANFSIYGFTLADGYLICDLNNSPNFSLTTQNTYQQKRLYEKNSEEPQTPVLSSVAVVDMPSKTEYYIGDSFDSTGLSILLTYSDLTTRELTEGYNVSGFESSSAGVKTLTVSYGGKRTTFEVTVRSPEIILSETDINLASGSKIALSAICDPADVSVVWSSSDSSVASVSSAGVVEGISEGTAVITASFVYNGKTYSATCAVVSDCRHNATNTVPAVASSCVAQGHGEYTVCATCGIIIDGSDEPLPFASHTFAENPLAKYRLSDATCAKKAVYSKSCGVCGIRGDETFEYGTTDNSAHGETVTVGIVAPGCTTTGYTGDAVCEDCGYVRLKGRSIPSEGHVSDMLKGKEATCDEEGLSDGEICIECGEILVPCQVIPAAEHDYVSVVIAPTCVHEGYTVNTCRKCNASFSDNYTPKTQHTAKNEICDYCEKIIIEEGKTIVFSFTSGTKYENIVWVLVKEHATVGEQGVNITGGFLFGGEYYANVTGVSAGEDVLMVIADGDVLLQKHVEVISHEHASVAVEGYPASCTDTGLTDGEKCSVCGYVLKQQTEIPATGHAPGEWETVIVSQIGKDGLEQQKCAVCGDVVDERVIPAVEQTTEKTDETTKPQETTKTDETTTENTSSVLKGDVNGDGKVNAMDARLALRIAARLDVPTDIQKMASDYNGDGNINAMDARLILRKAARLE